MSVALSMAGTVSDGLCLGVQAQRLLLRSALQDPLNQRFVFLSETCAPLIPAATMYAQLMSEPKSRINACRKPDWDLNLDRSARPLRYSPCPCCMALLLANSGGAGLHSSQW